MARNLYNDPQRFIKRFWNKVAQCDHTPVCASCCWIWQGGIKNNHYGEFFVGRIAGKVTMVHAHRFMAEIIQGWLAPRPLCIMHICDNKSCVNPSHLQVATLQENTQDALRKGLIPLGERHYTHLRPEKVRRGEQITNSKLTTECVLMIYALRLQGMQQKALAQRFGVSESHIGFLLQGKSWKHIYPLELRDKLIHPPRD